MSINVDHISKWISVISAVLAILLGVMQFLLNRELKKLEKRTEVLNQELKIAEKNIMETEARLKEVESNRTLAFQLYKEVRTILSNKDKKAQDEEALRVLIETLAEDPFRYKLLRVLAVGATSPETKRLASESSSFFQEESQILPRQTVPASSTGRGSNLNHGSR